MGWFSDRAARKEAAARISTLQDVEKLSVDDVIERSLYLNAAHTQLLKRIVLGVSTLEDALAAGGVDLSGASSLSAISADVANLQTDLAVLQSVGADLATVQSDLTDVQSSVAGLLDDPTTQAKLDGVYMRLYDRIGNVQSSVTALQSVVDQIPAGEDGSSINFVGTITAVDMSALNNQLLNEEIEIPKNDVYFVTGDVTYQNPNQIRMYVSTGSGGWVTSPDIRGLPGAAGPIGPRGPKGDIGAPGPTPDLSPYALLDSSSQTIKTQTVETQLLTFDADNNIMVVPSSFGSRLAVVDQALSDPEQANYIVLKNDLPGAIQAELVRLGLTTA